MSVPPKERIRRYLEENCLGGESLADEVPLLETGVLDSLGMLNLVGFLEDEFSLVLSGEDLQVQRFETLSSIAELVRGGGR